MAVQQQNKHLAINPVAVPQTGALTGLRYASETVATIVIGYFARNIRSPSALPQRKVAVESVVTLAVIDES